MKIKFKFFSNSLSLLCSIIFFIVGAVLFTKAKEVVKVISISFGLLLCVIAIIQLTLFVSKKEEMNSKKYLIIGVLSIILAIVFIFYSDFIEQFLRFIIGGLILFSGLSRIIELLSYTKNKTYFWTSILLSLILIFIGAYTIVFSNLMLQTAGLFIMLYSVITIIGIIIRAIYQRKGMGTDEKDVFLPEPVSENEEVVKKKKNVKEAKITKKSKKK